MLSSGSLATTIMLLYIILQKNKLKNSKKLKINSIFLATFVLAYIEDII
jgi:hypothetical protein